MTIRLLSRRARVRRGAAAIEFVLTAPIIVSMLFFSVEIGNYLSNLGVMTGIAQDAVRYGAKAENFARAQIRTQLAAETLLNDMGDMCNGGCTLRTTVVADAGVNFLQLEMTVPYQSITGIIPSATGSGGGIVPPQFYTVRALYPHFGASILSN